jgi:biopolymer transport protein ExbD
MVYVIFLWAFVPSWLAVGSSMHYIPAGLTVRVLGPRTVVGSKLAGETLSVWIDARNQWYFNSKPTTQEELPRLLREGLARQASQVVYMDADDHVDFNVVVRAVDIVRREHAQVILITTRDRGDAAGAVPRK